MNIMDTAEFLEIECPNCEAEYRIPIKYCGENALCDTCSVLFQIPTFEQLSRAEEQPDQENIPQPVSDKTVKLDRKSIGMIPEADAEKIFDTSNYMIPENKKPEKKRRVFEI